MIWIIWIPFDRVITDLESHSSGATYSCELADQGRSQQLNNDAFSKRGDDYN